jgi:hypothetical protein
VQASGDITLHFGIQQENDYEVRDNYDLDNGLTDGCTGTDCSGLNTSVDGFFTQETRLIVQGSQGDIWKMRLTMEAAEPKLEGRDEQPTINVERAWADIKIYDTPVHVKFGAPLWDQLDPFRLVWSDDEPGIKVYASHGNISWAVWWLKEDDSNGIQTVAENNGRDQDQDYYLARVDLDFGSFQVSPIFGYVRNRTTTTDLRFARGPNGFFLNGDNEDSGTAISADETLWYPGVIAKGTFGPVSFIGEFAAALGEIGDDSSVDTQREQDVSAFMVAVDVGVKLGAWTPHAGIIWMSGDDNPLDDDAEAWAGIASDNENLLGTRGIIMDDSIGVLEIADDALTADGVSPTARQFSTQPGMIAVFAGLKGRPTKKIKTDLNLIYFQWDAEKQFEYRDGIVTTVNCGDTGGPGPTGPVLGLTCPNTTFTNAIPHDPLDPTTTGLVTTIDDEVGWELNGAVTYSYNKHVTLTMAAAVFWPGDGAEVLAQCVNASINNEKKTKTGSTQAGRLGCDLGTASTEAMVIPNERGDDEAFNVEVELMVQF